MVLWALDGMKDFTVSQFVFVLLREHEERYHVKRLLKNYLNVKFSFALLDEVTEGQLCTVLKASEYIDREEDVLVSSSDTLVLGNMQGDALSSKWDGLISVANLPGDQWSFAKTNETGEVIEVSEKVRISDHASTGQYYFRRGKDLVNFGLEMVEKTEMTRGEYFVIPVYQKMMAAGLKIGISQCTQMWDLGTPEAKIFFERNYLNK